MNLFEYSPQVLADNWKPDELPSLEGITDIQLNVETNGLRWWDDHHIIGLSLRLPDSRTFYFPTRHKTGGNLDEDTVRRWAQTELRRKRITNSNTRFDCHMLYKWGVDLEDQDCRLSDVQHYAALLDDHRQRFSIDILCRDLLGEDPRIARLDESRMEYYHPAEVAPRSKYNVQLVAQLREAMWPQLTAENLQPVRTLEDDCIYVTCAMERRGVRLNLDLLFQWLKESEILLHELLMGVNKAIGRQTQEALFEGGKWGNFINPDSSGDMELLFTRLGLPISRTEKGAPSFTGSILQKIDHPVIKLVLKAGKLIDIRNKYLIPWSRVVNQQTGILRYAMNQLRAQKDRWDESSAGTISGRYSSTRLDSDEGVNIQQVVKPAKQRLMFGFADDDKSHDDEIFIIRKLCIPRDPKKLFQSSDAMQEEYRLFACETRSPRLLNIYKENPKASFHKETHKMFQAYKPDLSYRRGKDLNFAKIYGAGVRKLALMLGFISNEEYRELVQIHDKSWWDDPRLKETFEINKIYNQVIPEVKPLITRTSDLAKKQGFIPSILGRRSRFPNGYKTHKALNTRIQPSGADILKVKMVMLHRAEQELGAMLIFTVHDEVCCEVEDAEAARRVHDKLNEQSFRTLVPILWETGIGPNWYDLTDIEKMKKKEKENEFTGAHTADPNRGSLPIPGEDPEDTYDNSHKHRRK